MSDNTAQQEQFTPISSQEELDTIIKSRLARERAKFEGFDDYKAKAEKYDEVMAANKTELEKALERAQAAEGRIAEFERREERNGWNDSVAQETGLPSSLIADFSAGSYDELLEKATRHAGSLKRPSIPHVSNEGKRPSEPNMSPQDVFAEFAQTQLFR